MQAKAFLLNKPGPPSVFPELLLEISLALSHFEKEPFFYSLFF